MIKSTVVFILFLEILSERQVKTGLIISQLIGVSDILLLYQALVMCIPHIIICKQMTL